MTINRQLTPLHQYPARKFAIDDFKLFVVEKNMAFDVSYMAAVHVLINNADARHYTTQWTIG